MLADGMTRDGVYPGTRTCQYFAIESVDDVGRRCSRWIWGLMRPSCMDCVVKPPEVRTVGTQVFRTDPAQNVHKLVRMSRWRYPPSIGIVAALIVTCILRSTWISFCEGIQVSLDDPHQYVDQESGQRKAVIRIRWVGATIHGEDGLIQIT